MERNYVVSGYEPKKLFEFFEDISRIPHGSGNETGIADYLVAFAEQRGIECYRDAVNNVFYRIPATKGREQDAPVLLQGHIDMVCEKNGDVMHDFLRDPLSLYVENGYLRARGTTLGADNGVAVAAMMAVADGLVESHPEVECLFTSSEETGLDGANGFDYSRVRSRILLNMDSEGEDSVTVGCAGGVRSDLTFSPVWEVSSGTALRISVRGLAGGHSGVDIATGKANANKLVGRVLLRLLGMTEFSLASLRGGSKENAIPRECEAVIVLPQDCADRMAEALRTELSAAGKELGKEDAREYAFDVSFMECPAEMISAEDTRKIVTLVGCLDNGVLKMSDSAKGFVEWSRSLGVITTDEKQVSVVTSTRSAIEAQLDASIAELEAFARLTGATVRHYGRYPGWEYNPDSPVRDKYLRICKEVLGVEAKAFPVHAGLECGVIASRLPGLDAISFGPNMHGIHSPDEALDLVSTERFWKKIVALLGE